MAMRIGHLIDYTLYMNLVYWLTSFNLFGLALATSDIFLTFYIWDKSLNIRTITIYHLAMFITIPVFAVLSGIISEKKSPLGGYSIGLLIRTFVFAFVIIAPQFILANIWIFGVIYGASIGISAVSSNVINSKIFEESLENLMSLNTAIGSTINLLAPFLASLLVSSLGYNPLLIIAIFFLGLAWLMARKIKQLNFGDGKFSLVKVLFPIQKSENNLLFLTQLVEGVRSGFLWAYGGIIAYLFVGGLRSWGIYNLIFTGLTILLSFYFAKTLRLHLNKFFVVTTGLFYSLACLLLGVNSSLEYFLYYSFVLSFISAVGWSSFWGTINQIMKENPDFEKYRIEYYVAMEFPLALGRIIPLVIILISNTQQFSDFGIKLSWILIGIIPIISFSLLNKSQVWK